MKFKLDENLPERCRVVFADLGHDAHTVRAEGLGGSDDSTVLAAAVAEARMLVTLDKGFGDPRLYPPGTHDGILVLRLLDQRADAIADSLRVVLANYRLEELHGCVAILQRGVLRINWPTSD